MTAYVYFDLSATHVGPLLVELCPVEVSLIMSDEKMIRDPLIVVTIPSTMESQSAHALSINDANIQRVAFDFSQLPGPPAAVTQDEALLNASETDNFQPEQHNHSDTAPPPVAVTASKKSRSRVSYSKKKLYAKHNLFLNPVYVPEFYRECNTELMLEGQVMQCPKKANGNMFLIDWKFSGTNVKAGWIQPHLANNDDNKRLLLEAMEAQAARPAVVSLNNSQPKTPAKRKQKDPPPKPVYGPNGTPPLEIRAHAAAAFSTASTYSSISSLSGSSNSNSTRASLRSDPGSSVESETDDGDDLDEEDNAYQVLPPGTLPEDLDENNEEPNPEDIDGQSNTGDIGALIANLQWKYRAIADNESVYPTASLCDSETGLKPGISRRFKDPFNAMKVLGGFDYTFVARVTSNSNEYAKQFILPRYPNRRIHGEQWRSVTVAEMYHFLGIMLKISLSPVDGGGYPIYFNKENSRIAYSTEESPVVINNSAGFASDIMTLGRFKQIRMAYHPEDKAAAVGGDKCYQIRNALNTCNCAAKDSFTVGCNLTFDEGGIGCRSRFCPVRMYNSAKPQKFRVDLFILACASSYTVLHVDVYQGKNARNVNIDPSIVDLPTTQKAPLNACLQLGLQNEVDGMHHITLDNRYHCNQLAVGLRERAKCHSTGTVRSNRKGWNKDLMNLKKNKDTPRGKYIMLADDVNRLLAVQWIDSRVVNFVTTLNNTGVGKVTRQVGSNKLVIPCPNAAIKYQETMFGVDKGDQFRVHGGGFAQKAHFKKWYKKVHLAILDIMLMNAFVGWNFAASEQTSSKLTLKRHHFYTIVAESMLYFREANPKGMAAEEILNQSATILFLEGETHQAHQSTDNNARCCVCKIEANMGLGLSGTGTNVSICNICHKTAHNFVPAASNRFIHQLEQFRGLTCFQIAHHTEGCTIWNQQRGTRGVWYSVRTGHPIVMDLRVRHGLTAKKQRTKGTSGDDMSTVV